MAIERRITPSRRGQRVDVAQHALAVGPRAGEQLERARGLQRDHRRRRRACGSRARARRCSSCGLERQVDDLGDPVARVAAAPAAPRVPGVARPCRSAWRGSSPSASASAPRSRGRRARAERARRAPRARSSLDVDHGQPLARRAPAIAWRDGGARAAGAEQHDALGARARQPALERLARSRSRRCCGRPRGRRRSTTVLTAPSAAASGDSSSSSRDHELLARVGDVEPAEAGALGLAHQRADVARGAAELVDVEQPVLVVEAEPRGLALVQRGAERRADAGADQADDARVVSRSRLRPSIMYEPVRYLPRGAAAATRPRTMPGWATAAAPVAARRRAHPAGDPRRRHPRVRRAAASRARASTRSPRAPAPPSG